MKRTSLRESVVNRVFGKGGSKSWALSAANIRQEVSGKALREEYYGLKRVAERRLERLERHGFEGYYTNGGEGWPQLRSLKTDAEVARELEKLMRFLNSPTSTITGQNELTDRRRSAIEERFGFKFDSRDDFRDFYEYMNELRDRYGGSSLWDSDQAVKMFGESGGKAAKKAYEDWRKSQQRKASRFSRFRKTRKPGKRR